MSDPQASESAQSVTIIGAGNIGSHTAPLIARFPSVDRVTVVDSGTWETKDLQGQAVRRDQVGRPKAEALGETLRGIRPELETRSLVQRVEDVPPGLLRASVLLACLDSKRARIAVNEVAWRLDLPWVDAGVLADRRLARVTVFVPSVTGPCYECGLETAAYRTIEVVHACQSGSRPEAPTNAPAWLGSLAGSLQAAACSSLLAGDSASSGIGRRLLFDAAGRQLHDGNLRRNPRCRFDHRTWHPRLLSESPEGFGVRSALRLAAGGAAVDPAAALMVPGRPFARRLRCPRGHSRQVLGLVGRLPLEAQTCELCGDRLQPVGFELLSALTSGQLVEAELDLSLHQLGFLPGDIFAVTGPSGARYFEFGT